MAKLRTVKMVRNWNWAVQTKVDVRVNQKYQMLDLHACPTEWKMEGRLVYLLPHLAKAVNVGLAFTIQLTEY
jgi:hypothetical protein